MEHLKNDRKEKNSISTGPHRKKVKSQQNSAQKTQNQDQKTPNSVHRSESTETLEQIQEQKEFEKLKEVGGDMK